MRYTLFILMTILLVSCASSKQAKKNAEQMESAPEWVKSRPIIKSYYIGIAKINKESYPDSYHETAKKVALNDLASEISVNIQSNSIVSSYEDNAGFQSEFSRYIEMEMTKDLAGYQMQGSYETDETYMVYYRLSKSTWANIQAERKKAAADRANSLFQQANKEKLVLNYPSAISNYFNALLELKKYWNEPVFIKKDDIEIRLDLEIRSALLDILSDINLQSTPNNLPLNISNRFRNSIQLSVINSKGSQLEGFPILVSYRKSSIPFQTKVMSGTKPISVPIEDIIFKMSDLYISVDLIKSEIIQLKSEDKKLLKVISDALKINTINTPVYYQLPNIYISSTSSESPNYHLLKDAIKQALGKQEFTITSNIDEADLIFEMNVHESQAKSEAELKSSFVSYTIEVKNKITTKTIYTFNSPSYKGVDYSQSVALEKAYRLANEEIEDSSFNDMLSSILE